MTATAQVIDKDEQRAVVLAPATQMTPMDMLQHALDRGANVDVMEKLLTMQERWESSQARKAFDAAMAGAKADLPIIIKNREVDFTSPKGRTNYRHEDLAGIARQVDPILARHGLSYRFRVSSELNEPVKVTCILSHRDGHSEETTLAAGRDESGNKNTIQGVGSTVTYLQRYTLKAALGLAASADDDGAAAGGDAGTITDEQAKELRKLIAEAGANEVKFCDYLKIGLLEELPMSKLSAAHAALQAKRKKA